MSQVRKICSGLFFICTLTNWLTHSQIFWLLLFILKYKIYNLCPVGSLTFLQHSSVSIQSEFKAKLDILINFSALKYFLAWVLNNIFCFVVEKIRIPKHNWIGNWLTVNLKKWREKWTSVIRTSVLSTAVNI